jgi:hypothetical protein
MSVTPNMDLVLPTVSVTQGPLWATEVNEALTTIDAHDHSTDKGVKITPTGLNINTDLPINEHVLQEVGSVELVNQVAPLTTASVVNQSGGDLYWTNSSGTPVQITSGGSVIAASDGISRRFESFSVVANKVISPADTFSYLAVNTGSAYQITLPSAAGVPAGRFYEIADATGTAGTNNITVALDGTDTSNGSTGSVVLNYNRIRARFESDGVSNWTMTVIGGTLQLQTAQYADGSVTTAKILDANVTPAKLSASGYQASASSGTFTRTATSYADVTNLTVTVTANSGRPVQLYIYCDSASGFISASRGASSVSTQFQVLRGVTVIYEGLLNMTATGSTTVITSIPAGISFPDLPGAGSFTYKVQAKVNNGTSAETITFSDIKLAALPT